MGYESRRNGRPADTVLLPIRDQLGRGLRTGDMIILSQPSAPVVTVEDFTRTHPGLPPNVGLLTLVQVIQFPVPLDQPIPGLFLTKRPETAPSQLQPEPIGPRLVVTDADPTPEEEA